MKVLVYVIVEFDINRYMCVCVWCLGVKVPAHATVVFDVLLIDVFNVKDDVQVEILHVPQPCRRKSQKGDFIRYHYNGTFQDGTLFDSR